jgi:hypothetical protein
MESIQAALNPKMFSSSGEKGALKNKESIPRGMAVSLLSKVLHDPDWRHPTNELFRESNEITTM